MEKFAEAQVFPNVSKSFEDLRSAIRIFKNLLEEGVAFNTANYYKARNFVKSGENFYQEALKNVRKLLGPLPEYASEEFIKWREEIVEKRHILAKSQEFDTLKSELLEDENLTNWLSADEIAFYLQEHFRSQQEGKRKLANIKVRIILVKLQELILQAKDLQKKAFDKQPSSV
jgi:hypothetical protein